MFNDNEIYGAYMLNEEDPAQSKYNYTDILESNKDKNFIKRILDPSLNKGKGIQIEGEDGLSSHYMTYGESDGKYYVYPTVVDKGGNKFEHLADNAFEYALENDEFIIFDTEEEAAAFSEGGYKTKEFKESSINIDEIPFNL